MVVVPVRLSTARHAAPLVVPLGPVGHAPVTPGYGGVVETPEVVVVATAPAAPTDEASPQVEPPVGADNTRVVETAPDLGRPAVLARPETGTRGTETEAAIGRAVVGLLSVATVLLVLV